MAFEEYHQALFAEEWSALRTALLAPRRHVARLTHQGKLNADVVEGIDSVAGIPDCFDPKEPRIEGLLTEHPEWFYLMDLGSVLAARQIAQLDWGNGWDVCAAPGGKSLILLESLNPDASILLTDLSRTRLEKLKHVIRTYHDDSILGLDRVRTKVADGVNWGYRRQDTYDAVLLDAPCSSERHVIADDSALAQWTPNRVKSLAKRQYALLCSAVLSCRAGGHVLYSTCSINPAENDAVIERYLKKKKDVSVCELLTPIGENTEYGFMIRPDRHEGWGPLYFTLLQKQS